MYRIPGQITRRLLADPALNLDGWYPSREASLRTKCRPAAVGYRITGRRRRDRAMLLQLVAVAALVIAGWVLTFIGDEIYPAVGGGKTPPFCHVERPAGGLPTCYGVDRIGDLP